MWTYFRIYTILPPHFYEALKEFNETQETPLWLVHGIWSPEEQLIGEDHKENDAFTPAIREKFMQEIIDAVRASNGDLNRPAKPGHASVVYNHDVSPYIMSWLVGTEWFLRGKMNGLRSRGTRWTSYCQENGGINGSIV
ncbi:hypothetical protein [Ammoniphilus sp. CFH 90114]|uniref:hypothetical protein n=1 Tax=Ammoniphilus sp. CFH 90114 TaxID=2493665 RepID=UPI00100E196B|nr:hypothetical protein [Ammoniphilus sp. CFH 90114]RXT02369.1 hypothetical protein EIZ39_24675 [Ammoniphilus sp. CFH 90114]